MRPQSIAIALLIALVLLGLAERHQQRQEQGAADRAVRAALIRALENERAIHALLEDLIRSRERAVRRGRVGEDYDAVVSDLVHVFEGQIELLRRAEALIDQERHADLKEVVGMWCGEARGVLAALEEYRRLEIPSLDGLARADMSTDPSVTVVSTGAGRGE